MRSEMRSWQYPSFQGSFTTRCTPSNCSEIEYETSDGEAVPIKVHETVAVHLMFGAVRQLDISGYGSMAEGKDGFEYEKCSAQPRKAKAHITRLDVIRVLVLSRYSFRKQETHQFGVIGPHGLALGGSDGSTFCSDGESSRSRRPDAFERGRVLQIRGGIVSTETLN